MNNIIALDFGVSTLFLLYIMTYFTQALSGKRQFYGISLNSDYFSKKEFKALDKKFKFLLTIGFIISLVFNLIFIYVFKSYELSTIVPILAFIFYQFIIYVYIHKKAKALKDELLLTVPDLDLPKTKVLLDTEFLNEKDKIVRFYSFIYIIPLISVILVSIYYLTQYKSIPDMMPIHWGFSGEPDDFVKKTFTKFLAQIFMMIGLGFIIYISSIASLKTRAKLSSNNIYNSKKTHLYYLNKFGITFLVLNITCQIMFILVLLATVTGDNINTFLMLLNTAILTLSSIYLSYLYYKSPGKNKEAIYSVDDDDSLWIFGCLYNNPNDPSFFIQKRFGVGWTVNIGTTKGKLFFVLPFIIILIPLLITFLG